MEKYLRTKDIMDIFGCGKNKAYAIMNSDGFPTIQIGKTKYVPEEALKRWTNDYLHKKYKLD